MVFSYILYVNGIQSIRLIKYRAEDQFFGFYAIAQSQGDFAAAFCNKDACAFSFRCFLLKLDDALDEGVLKAGDQDAHTKDFDLLRNGFFWEYATVE